MTQPEWKVAVQCDVAMFKHCRLAWVLENISIEKLEVFPVPRIKNEVSQNTGSAAFVCEMRSCWPS